MNFLKIAATFFFLMPSAHAGVEVIEWGDGGIENYTVNQSDNVVDIYVTSWCPYCRRAIAYLQSRGIKFNQFDIEKDAEAAARKKALAPGYSGIPLAVINGSIVKGFNRGRYEDLLNEMDY